MPYKDKDKNRESVNAYHEKNKEELKLYRAEWYQKNKEKKKADSKAWNKANAEHKKTRDAAYQKANRDISNASGAAYKLRKLQATPELTPVEQEQIQAIYTEADHRNSATTIEWQVDHIVPIAVGGLHIPENLQVVPKAWNTSKRHLNSERWPYAY